MPNMCSRSVCALLLGLLLALPGAASTYAAARVGDGSPASCTFAALKAAIEAGGDIMFNCGSAPATITFSETIEIRNTVSIDGEGQITLDGNGRRLFFHRSYASTASELTLKNLTITGGRASGANEAANGGAIRSVNNSLDGKSFPQVLTLDNVTFQNNDTTLTSFSGAGLNAYDFGGGAIFSQGGKVIVKGSTFRDNDANNGAGGAIHILQSSLAIETSMFANNSAIGASPKDSLGGAIYIDGLGVTDESARFSLAGSTFEGNRAYNSGGAIHVNMYHDTNTFTIDRTTFANNAVTGGERAQGGAIGGGGTGSSPQITIARSLFSGNTAKKSGSPSDGSGGALAFPQRATIRIENSTFSGNRAEGSSYNANGGALYVVNNTVPFQIVNSTFANNFAGWVGGAISTSKVGDQPGGAVTNTLFVNNTADNGPNDWNIQQHCSSELSDGGNNMQFPGRLTGDNFSNDVTCLQGKSGTAKKNLPDFGDPKLQALAENGGPTRTMAIPLDSPALDSGKPSACPPTDQRGIARPQGAGCDIGAFELVQQLAVSPNLIGRTDPTFTLTVRGAGFTNASMIVINGTQRATTFVDSATLTTRISGADFSSAGTFEVTVTGSALTAAQLRVAEQLTRTYAPLARR